jgi:hypothetical protein
MQGLRELWAKTDGYSLYVLFLLFVIYLLNQADRYTLVSAYSFTN